MRHPQKKMTKGYRSRLPQIIKVTFVTLRGSVTPSKHNSSFYSLLSCLVQRSETSHSFIHSFDKYLLNIYYVPGTVQTLDMAVNQTKSLLSRSLHPGMWR